MSHKTKSPPAGANGDGRRAEAIHITLELDSNLPQGDCQHSLTLDEQLAQAEARLDSAPTDDEWVEAFLEWLDLCGQKMGVSNG